MSCIVFNAINLLARSNVAMKILLLPRSADHVLQTDVSEDHHPMTALCTSEFPDAAFL